VITSATTPDAEANVIVYAVVDDALSRDFPPGDAIETFVCREDAQRFIDEVCGDDPELEPTCGSRSASSKRAGGRN